MLLKDRGRSSPEQRDYKPLFLAACPLRSSREQRDCKTLFLAARQSAVCARLLRHVLMPEQDWIQQNLAPRG
jgi:hypothetical protein